MKTIPKIIHYCWVGGAPKPESVLYCIESWKKFCPDYEIREWNESNYDFTINPYMHQAYEAKRWGFVPDYARLDIIYKYGGIYLDTDVELVRSFDDLLNTESFFGFEDTGEGTYFVACGLGFGAMPNNELIRKLRDYYDTVSFQLDDGSLNLMPAPRHNEKTFSEYGVIMNNLYQIIGGNAFYPSEYFCPKVFKTGKMLMTKNTYSIHHFSASWMDDEIRKNIEHSQNICLKFGDRIGHLILWLESVWKKYGILGGIKKLLIRIYEYWYSWFPLLSAYIKRPFIKRHNINNIILFDTSQNTKNMGDQIIMENCLLQLEDTINYHNAKHISTHTIPEIDEIFDGKTKILCGTNILSCKMRTYKLWKLPRKIDLYYDIILLGIGFDSYNDKPDLYTKLFMKYILSREGLHSVRDSFSERCLRKMGIKNVINTCCPTMWNLTPEHCATIPKQMSKNVVCTVTDYCQDIEYDKAMIKILLECYHTVYLWLQGDKDLDYIRILGVEKKVILIQNTLEAYDEVLSIDDLDYIGTRLHAGIRALSKGHRSIIISIDNRAECIATDTGLPVVARKNVPTELRKRITSDFVTKISLPIENIEKWKMQFE